MYNCQQKRFLFLKHRVIFSLSLLKFMNATNGNCGSRFLLSREVGNAVGKNFYTSGCLEPQ